MYQHYKGNLYELVCEGYLESNEQKMVVYKDCESNKKWIRPYEEFYGRVEVEGKQISRFSEYDPNILTCATCQKVLTDKDNSYLLDPPHPISEWDINNNQKRKQVYICCNKIRMHDPNTGELIDYPIPDNVNYMRVQ
jgi:hypothetical protein